MSDGLTLVGKDRGRKFEIPLSHVEEYEIYKKRMQNGYKLRCSLSKITDEIEEYFRDEFGATDNPTGFSDHTPEHYLDERTFEIETTDNSNVVRSRIMEQVKEKGETRKHVSGYSGRAAYTKYLPAEDTEIEYNGETIVMAGENQ